MGFLLEPRREWSDSAELLDDFLNYVEGLGIELYEAQEEAILELFAGKNVILNTPTGSGKSLVAAALHYFSACRGQRSVYTCPVKALVNEKFLSLCRDFGPQQVGMMTGDATVNRDAPILCCTAEILANMALRDGRRSPVDQVIMDEFHYYSDVDRGGAWQVPLLRMSGAQFLLISATLGETGFFESELVRVTGRESVTVRSYERPVPLHFEYTEESMIETLEGLLGAGKMPVYVVHFSQRSACETAQNLLSSLSPSSKAEKEKLAEVLVDVKFNSPYGKEMKKLLRSGIGVHHAGLLPKYRVLVEKLAQQGLLKIICGTDTLGVGVNVPIRTVLFTQLTKYDGHKMGVLTARDFHQISGRAGRRGYDDVGFVVALAPEHVAENKKLEAKAAGDAKKLRKLVKKKPPERGYVHWDESTFAKLTNAAPEPLQSQFSINHGLLLNVLAGEDDGCAAMRELIRTCHQAESEKPAMRRHAFQLFRSLVERGLIEIHPASATGAIETETECIQAAADKRKLEVNVELQDDFSLNQTLALYCIDNLGGLDTTAEDYVFKLLTLAESILEDPAVILRKQLDKVKDEAVRSMKEDGVDYETRMDELEQLEYPKPEREWIYQTFNEFAEQHPWVGEENIRPKSIAREMFEEHSSFEDYIKKYGLMRSEGVLLRYLTQVYRVVLNTIPQQFRTAAVEELIIYLREVVRQTDASLIEEWEQLCRLQQMDGQVVSESIDKPQVTLAEAENSRQSGSGAPQLDEVQRLNLIRHEVFRFLRLLANRDYAGLVAAFDVSCWLGEERFPLREIEMRMAAYFADGRQIRLDPAARGKELTKVIKGPSKENYRIEQVLVDTHESNDWVASFEVSFDEQGQEVRLVPLGLDSAFG